MDAFHRSSLGEYRKGPTAFSTGLLMQYHKVPAADNLLQTTPFPAADSLRQTKPFSLIIPRRTDSASEKPDIKRIELENNVERSHEILASGMVLLRNYLSISDQVEVVNICQELGVGPGGFYQHGFSSGSKMSLHRMFFGLNWDPQSYSWKRFRSDGFEAPPLPDQFISLVETTLEEAADLSESKDEVPFMSPDICIVNFYTTTDRLNLHQDKSESRDSLRKGLPVVSFSIGDTAEFVYSLTDDTEKTKKVWLKSGDVLIFGGKSRHIFHGVSRIIPNSAPLSLLKETGLRPGRLNLTFRKH